MGDGWIFLMRNVITHELLEYSWVNCDECWFMGPRGHFLLSYGSRNMRRVDIFAG